MPPLTLITSHEITDIDSDFAAFENKNSIINTSLKPSKVVKSTGSNARDSISCSVKLSENLRAEYERETYMPLAMPLFKSSDGPQMSYSKKSLVDLSNLGNKCRKYTCRNVEFEANPNSSWF